jgi:predicted nucleotidyltransferase
MDGVLNEKRRKSVLRTVQPLKNPAARFSEKIPFILSLILNSVDRSIIQKIYLFGSYAYGRPKKSSDIDICVVLNDGVDRPGTYLKIALALSNNDISPCDLLVYNAYVFFSQENPLSIENTIIQYGKVLYG